jgi:hypothetical protein
MDNVSTEVKELYNLHLHTSRTFRRKPFRARKKFEDFEEDPRYPHYLFLTKWFRKHSDINRQMFFEATLYFHKEEEFIHIKEYATKSQALTNYVQYCKIIDGLDLDNPKSLRFCMESYKFIRKFCKEKGVKLSEYLEYREAGCQPHFWIHIKGHNICRYSLFPFPDYDTKLKRLYREQELWGMYLGSGDFSPFFFKQRYDASKKYKKLSKEIKLKVENTPPTS